MLFAPGFLRDTFAEIGPWLCLGFPFAVMALFMVLIKFHRKPREPIPIEERPGFPVVQESPNCEDDDARP